MSDCSADFFSTKSNFGAPIHDLEEPDVYDQVPEKEWRSVLVEGQCQSGKTFRVIQLLKEKIAANSGTLILIITQANSGASADQTLERMQADLTSIVDIENMSKTCSASVTFKPIKNQLVVDFWHVRNMGIMKECAMNFKHVVIVIDEADQAGKTGISSRMRFVSDIEQIVPDCKLFLVTATTANLSKSILKFSETDGPRFKRGSLVHDILYEESVEYQNVSPSDNYVSTSRMLEGEVWYLEYKSKKMLKGDEDYNEHKTDTILKKINELPDEKKEMTMIAVSSLTEDHRNMVQPLMFSGYNVVVEMNGKNNKDYRVTYMANGKIKEWNIPTKKIYQLADDSSLARLSTLNSDYDTGVVKKENIRLPDILQSALFMGTDRMSRIKNNVSRRVFIKLRVISNALKNSCGKLNRPLDYPSCPNVALVVGNLASRGITFQDPYIDLLCTSFVFTDLADSVERGARSTQRFGRACGNFFYKYKDGRKPIVIATEKIVESALANYNAVYENSKNIKNGEMISLRNYIDESEWKEFRKSAKDTVKSSMKTNVVETRSIADMAARVKKCMNPKEQTVVAKIFRYLYENTKDGSFITLRDLKDGIKYEKGDAELVANVNGGQCLKGCYGKLWVFKNQLIQINKSLLKYV
jgi:hypothetical protein